MLHIFWHLFACSPFAYTQSISKFHMLSKWIPTIFVFLVFICCESAEFRWYKFWALISFNWNGTHLLDATQNCSNRSKIKCLHTQPTNHRYSLYTLHHCHHYLYKYNLMIMIMIIVIQFNGMAFWCRWCQMRHTFSLLLVLPFFYGRHAVGAIQRAE